MCDVTHVCDVCDISTGVKQRLVCIYVCRGPGILRAEENIDVRVSRVTRYMCLKSLMCETSSIVMKKIDSPVSCVT